MPNQDGTGPVGQGSSTGRGFGFCRSNTFFSRRGFGRCFGRFNNYPVNQENQKQMLGDYKQALNEELRGVEEELNNLVENKS